MNMTRRRGAPAKWLGATPPPVSTCARWPLCERRATGLSGRPVSRMQRRTGSSRSACPGRFHAHEAHLPVAGFFARPVLAHLPVRRLGTFSNPTVRPGGKAPMRHHDAVAQGDALERERDEPVRHSASFHVALDSETLPKDGLPPAISRRRPDRPPTPS